MASLETPPNPAQPSPPGTPAPVPPAPIKVRTGRYGELEEHELIHLLDSIDDERARARFRESVYISLFVWIFIAWFAIYGPRFLWHQPRLISPSDVLKQREMTLLNAPADITRALPRKTPSAAATRPSSKSLARLRAEAPRPAPAPTPPPPPLPPQPTPLPAVTPPPTPTPQPRQPIPEAPAPNPSTFRQPETAGDAMRAAAAGPRSGSGIPSIPSHLSGRPNLAPGAQILSDTQGVYFGDYLARLLADIKRNWEPLLPESVNPPISSKGITGIRFSILPNGELDAGQPPVLETRSGQVALDRAAWAAIVSEGRFQPLPKAYHGPLELRIGFYVNEPVPNN